ncbi:MAG TPA: SPOR domain-containing protein [candidate division Zixibacteria bacterium]|nr:SPOR domain-containing protein [candidate division Zixibacteria bacterium]
MYFWKTIIVVFALLALTLACADKKEEAEKLEQEMMAQEQPVDTTPVQEVVSDTTSPKPAMDYSATPEEETTYQADIVTGTGYTVQVASCEDMTYAQYLKKKYTSRGYEAFVTTFMLDGQTYYRVRLGKFDGYSQAKALQEEVIDKYSVPAWVGNLGE